MEKLTGPVPISNLLLGPGPDSIILSEDCLPGCNYVFESPDSSGTWDGPVVHVKTRRESPLLPVVQERVMYPFRPPRTVQTPGTSVVSSPRRPISPVGRRPVSLSHSSHRGVPGPGTTEVRTGGRAGVRGEGPPRQGT